MVQVTNPAKNIQTWGIPGIGKGNVRLSPGVNEVPEDVAKFLVQHPVFKAFLEKGLISVAKDFMDKLKNESSDDGKDEVTESLDNLSQREALKLIGTSKDVDYLKEVIATDSRAKIVDAAKAQLKTLGQ